MSFSDRMGHTPQRRVIQHEMMDFALRSALWDALDAAYWRLLDHGRFDTILQALLQALWRGYFNQPADAVPDNLDVAVAGLRDYFFRCLWFEVYNIVEWVPALDTHIHHQAAFMAECNETLYAHRAAYRFQKNKVTPILAREAAASLNRVLANAALAAHPAVQHLLDAWMLMTHPTAPNYPAAIRFVWQAVLACQSGRSLPSAASASSLARYRTEVQKALETPMTMPTFEWARRVVVTGAEYVAEALGL